jgi:hypothetical protein
MKSSAGRIGRGCSRGIFVFFGFSFIWGCTLDAGHGFATLESTTFEARFEPGVARDLEGRWLTDRGYVVAIERFEIDVGELRIEQLDAGSATKSAFNPASPPAGYSLCHGGHCHADDGRLVSYAEIEAELAGGTAAFSAVATLPIRRRFQLRERVSVDLLEVVPSRELPEATLRRLALEIGRFELLGSVSGGRLTSATTLDIRLEAPVLVTGVLDLLIDRDGPGAFALGVALVVEGTLLDGIDLGASGPILIGDSESEASVRLLDALANSVVLAHVEER